MNARKFYDKMWSSEKAVNEDKEILGMRSQAIDYSYEIAEPHGKKMLEIGCGAGFQTLEFARRGASITAIDFSDSSVEKTKRRLTGHGLAADVLKMDAETLTFAPDTFDLIYINSVLMHVDKTKVFMGCARVLKKNGKVIVVEPLRYNPFVLPYRLFLSPYRNTNPVYMSVRQFKKYSGMFSKVKHREFYFFYVLTLPIHSNIKNWLQNTVSAMDAALLRHVPMLRRFCWVSVVEYSK